MHGIDLTTQRDIFYHDMNYAFKGIIDASCCGACKRRSAEEARQLIEDLAKCNYKAPSEASDLLFGFEICCCVVFNQVKKFILIIHSTQNNPTQPQLHQFISTKHAAAIRQFDPGSWFLNYSTTYLSIMKQRKLSKTTPNNQKHK